MTVDHSRRGRRAVIFGLAAIVVLDVGLRGYGLLTRATALNSAQFDEGVYASAAGSLSRGDIPYRDFVFLHPPGVAVFLAPAAWVAQAVGSWADFLVAARWLMVAVAAVNVALIALIAHRWMGWVAAAVSAVLAATYLPSVNTESHIMLEPLVALGILTCALTWVGGADGKRSNRRAVVAGVLAALTMSIKLTGVVALLALLFAEPIRSPWRQRRLALTAAAITGAALLVPFLAMAGPTTLFRQVVRTQLGRPGRDISGGTIVGVHDRLDHLGSYGPFALDRLGGSAGVLGAAFAVVAAVWAWRHGGPIGRFFATTAVAGAAAILVSPDYYDQYPVTTFVAVAILLGGGVAAAVRMAHARGWLPEIAVGLVALALLAGAGDTLTTVRDDLHRLDHDDPRAEVAAAIGRECVSGDLPESLLTLDRLPPVDSAGDRFVDPFGAMVDAAIRHTDYTTTQAALDSRAAQAVLRRALVACPYAVTRALDPLPPRWTSGTRSWFEDRFDS